MLIWTSVTNNLLWISFSCTVQLFSVCMLINGTAAEEPWSFHPKRVLVKFVTWFNFIFTKTATVPRFSVSAQSGIELDRAALPPIIKPINTQLQHLNSAHPIRPFRYDLMTDGEQTHNACDVPLDNWWLVRKWMDSLNNGSELDFSLWAGLSSGTI